MNTIIILVLKIYKKLLSPIIVAIFGKACRFTPTCSAYTIEALEKFGTYEALKLSFRRFAKCHPWGEFGYDPIPNK